MSKPTYNDKVFINGPFDDEDDAILKTLVYTIYRCGVIPKVAFDEDNALGYRMDELIRIIPDCK